ncbi:MAG: inositol monophosphatase family protein, partial [Cyclobacteriaceae bacterium]
MRKSILEESVHLVRTVGDFIRNAHSSFSMSDIEHKGFNDLVSYVDKEAEKKIVEGCRKIMPEAGFITEEGTASESGDRYRWIIDPLDGTTNFVHGLPIFAISLALADGNDIAIGIVYEIGKDELFHARQGEGAYCNGQRIRVSDISSLDASLLATGFPYYDFNQMPVYLDILNDFMQNTHGLRRMGSAAVDLAYTACGRFEG